MSRSSRIFAALCFSSLLIFNCMQAAQAQSGSLTKYGFDIAGSWSALVHEDWYDRAPGAGLGEFMGMPMTPAAQQKAETWDASILSQPERQAQPHLAQYSFRGPRPNLSIDRIYNPATDEVIGYRTFGTFGSADRTIWIDGREHPSDQLGIHTWSGFSTGEYHDGVFVVTTTHMKYGVYNRNGVPASPYGVMTEYFIRHGEYMTMFSHIEDPVYLAEPLVRSQTWEWNPPQADAMRMAFESVEEVAMPIGWVPHNPISTRHTAVADRLGISVEATRGNPDAIYPEYREILKQMRQEYDAAHPAE